MQLGLGGRPPLFLVASIPVLAFATVPYKSCTPKVGYIGGTPEDDPYRRGFDFWVDFANSNKGTDFSDGVFTDYAFKYEYYYYSFGGPHCGGIDAHHTIATADKSAAEAQVEAWNSEGVHLVIMGVEWQDSESYRKALAKHFINHFAVNVADWVFFRRGATEWTWGVGNSHFELGKHFVTLTARESQEGICLLIPETAGNFELVMYEALIKAVQSAEELGVAVLLEEAHGFGYVDDFNGTVNFLTGFAQRVVESGCDILMAFTRDTVGAALLQTQLAAVNAPLLAEFLLPEMPESDWASVGTIGEHVYTATPWHPTVNFNCPVFGNTGEFVAAYEEWEEQNYGVVRSPGLEEASAAVAGVLILLAQRDPWFYYAEEATEIQDVGKEELFGYRLMKVFEGIQVTTFYGDVHFDGRGQNFVKIPVTIQYFEDGVKYAVRPKGATTRAAALPMDSFESRENANESLPGCPPGTRLILRFDDGWTLRGKFCEACDPLQYQDEYNETMCKECPDGEVSGSGDSMCTPCSPGYFRAPGMHSCTLCAEGQFANSSGATGCERCPAGTVASDNSTVCTPCPAGHYSGPWDFECHKCNWGEFTDTPGATACERCPGGRFAAGEGQSYCEGCQAGYWAPESGGQRECQPCQMGFSTGGANESETCEPCADGFYSNETGSPVCSPCPDTFHTQEIASDSSEKCVCPPGSYWHRESENSEPTCQSLHCGTALVCEGWSNDPPTMAEGFSGGVQPFEGAAPEFLVKCGSVRQCPEGLELGECPIGHKDDRACAECEEGYSEVRSGQCVECEAMPFYVPILVGLGVMGFVVLFMYGLRKQEIDVESESVIKVTAVAGILMTSVQILGVFRYIAVDWPEPITTFHNGVALLLQPMELFNLNCVFSVKAPFASYALIMLMWPVFAVLVFLLFKTSGCLNRKHHNKISNNTIFQVEGMLILVFYTSISMLSLTPWQCEENPDLTASVVAYRQVICWDTGEHTGMIILSCLAVLIFVVGFLSLIAWATYLYPIQVTLPNGVRFLVRYRWIFNRFSPERHYHGLFYCTRNLVVTLLPVIFANNMPLQFLLVAMTLLTSLLFQCWLKPWKTELANKFDAACTTLLVLMLVVGSLLLHPDERDVDLIVTVFFSLAFAFIGLAFIFVVVYNLHLRLTHRKRYAYFLCHHKVAAAVLARWVKIELKLRYSGQEVFLDSDELNRLDTLFEVVSFQTENFVVLLTRETLKRIWCAGEITSALRQNLNVICVACNDYEEPTEEFIEKLDKIWSDTQITEVARQGVSLPQIKDAFRQFRELPKMTLDRNAPYHEQAKLIDEVLWRSTGMGKMRGTTVKRDSASSKESKASSEEHEAAVVSDGQGGHLASESKENTAPTPIHMEDAQSDSGKPSAAVIGHMSPGAEGSAIASGQLREDVEDSTTSSLPPPSAEEISVHGPSTAQTERVAEEIHRSSASISGVKPKAPAVERILGMIQRFDPRSVVNAMKMRAMAGALSFSKNTNLMVGNFADPEAAMVCRVIQLQLQQVLQKGIPLCRRKILEAVEQLQGQHPQYLIAVLTRGILSTPEFACVLAKACSLSPRPTLVPIVADYVFGFPDSSFYADLENGLVLDPQVLESHGVFLFEVERAYKSLFNVISKRFSSHGSEKIQLTEVQEIASLVQNFTDSQSTGETSSAPLEST